MPGLVEAKNAPIVRPHIGWGHQPVRYWLPEPLVNYHRPSGIDAKGRKRGLDKRWQTPFEDCSRLIVRNSSSARLSRSRIHERHRRRPTYAAG
jgi:hypothetical protein